MKIPALTQKDKKDFEAGIRLGVDVVSLSFVKCAEDVDSLRALMKARGYQVPIIAKIELREAVEKLDEIIEAADGVAVARGDLQVAYALSELPQLQRTIAETCNRKGKFVLIGSGVLTSMKEKLAPVLADVSDLFLSVECRPDAISFSDETAVGKYPIQCIQVMDKLITEMETQIKNVEAVSRKAVAIYHPEKVVQAAKSGRYHNIITVQEDKKLGNWLAMHQGVYVIFKSGNQKGQLSTVAESFAQKMGIIGADEHLLEPTSDKF